MNRALFTCLVAFAAVAASESAAHAQREIGVGVAYDPRIPLGGLHDLVGHPAFAGIQGKWEWYAIDQRLAFGFDLQYQYFQAGTETTTVAIPNGAATAPFTRYAYFLTAVPTARWFPGGPSLHTVRPFVEIGAGITDAVSAIQASDLSRRSESPGFIFQPSVGVLWTLVSRETGSANPEGDTTSVPRRREQMFGISASLAWALTTADIVTANDVTYVGLQLGVYSKL